MNPSSDVGYWTRDAVGIRKSDEGIELSVGDRTVFMSKTEAMTLCSEIRSKVERYGFCSVPVAMEYVGFYVLKDNLDRIRQVFVLARDAQGLWWSTMADCHGVALITPTRTKPSLTQFKPYFLTKDIADVEPIFAEFREAYARRALDDAGLGELPEFDPEDGFVDAAVNARGALCVLSSRHNHAGSKRYTYMVLSPREGISKVHYMSEDMEGPVKPLRDGLKHIDAEGARKMVLDYSADFFDYRLEIIRGWVQ